MNTRRQFVKIASLAIISSIIPNIDAKDNIISKFIDKWASKHAIALVRSTFVQQIFHKKNGEKFHAITPIAFVRLPMNNGKISKYVVEFPANIRQVPTANEKYDGLDIPLWKVQLFCKVKSWLKDQAINVYSKLPNVDFSKFQFEENA